MGTLVRVSKTEEMMVIMVVVVVVVVVVVTRVSSPSHGLHCGCVANDDRVN